MPVAFDLSRPWRSWTPAAQRVVLAAAVLVGLLGLGAQWRWQSQNLASSHAQLRELESSTKAASNSPETPSPSSTPVETRAAVDPAQWPEAFDGVDDWVRAAAQEAAKANGVALQRLTITRPEAVLGTNGAPLSAAQVYAVLQVSARGSYGNLKGWQGAMLEAMPSLAVESLRWQSPANDGTGLLNAEWTWRLWLRPPGGPGLQGSATVPSGVVSDRVALRPPLVPAATDPFGMPAPPAPPLPVAQVEAPPAPAAVQMPPAPPPLQWVTIGRMRGPDGQHRVTGHWGREQEIVTLGVGDLSPAGHKVTQITTTVMELQHPDSQDRQSFRLPPPPRFETR